MQKTAWPHEMIEGVIGALEEDRGARGGGPFNYRGDNATYEEYAKRAAQAANDRGPEE